MKLRPLISHTENSKISHKQKEERKKVPKEASERKMVNAEIKSGKWV